MLVLRHNGQTTVDTGGRAWLLAAPVLVGVTPLLAVIAFAVLGLAVAVGAMLLIVVPLAIGLAILASLLPPRQPGRR